MKSDSITFAPGVPEVGTRRSNSSGAEHVSAALAKGRGILFWAGNFSFNDLVTKMAWHRLGLAVSHFSRPIHGFSTTEFGVRYLNAVRRGIEDRYLGERLMVELHETQVATQRMRERLAANGAGPSPLAIGVTTPRPRVSSVAASHSRPGRSLSPEAWGRRCSRSLPCDLAPRRFEVTIGDRLEVPEDAAGNPDYAAAVQTYADSLAPFVLRDPGQWRGWRYTGRGR